MECHWRIMLRIIVAPCVRHARVRGFAIKDVPGDNNCQFHALADQLEQVGVSGFTAGKLRKLTVSWLQENGETMVSLL